jgi:hypothetical protein
VRRPLADRALVAPRAHTRHAALGCACVPPDEPERRRRHRWRDAWRGGGDVVTERHRHGDAFHRSNVARRRLNPVCSRMAPAARRRASAE